MSQLTSRDGTIIAFERSGDGPPVILVDGAMGYREHSGGRPLAAELSSEFTVITYDRLGRGESLDTQPYSVERETEDIEALIDQVGGPVYLCGFSSEAVLVLRAAARLGSNVAKLALLEPPFNSDDTAAKQETEEFSRQLAQLLDAGKRGDAVTLFFTAMLPPEMIVQMRQSPEWQKMEAVAPTLAYDNAVMGDGSVPLDAAKAATMPALILDGAESEEFKHEAADALARAMSKAQRKTLKGQTTRVSPAVLTPVLTEFFKS